MTESYIICLWPCELPNDLSLTVPQVDYYAVYVIYFKIHIAKVERESSYNFRKIFQNTYLPLFQTQINLRSGLGVLKEKKK